MTDGHRRAGVASRELEPALRSAASTLAPDSVASS